MRGLIAATVFFVLNILLLPITLLGYVIWVAKSIATGRGSGVSGTAHLGAPSIPIDGFPFPSPCACVGERRERGFGQP